MQWVHKIIKFMRNKQKALALHRGTEHALDLRRPAYTRFGIAFMMLERLWAQRFVLDEVVSSDKWRRARWTGNARTDEPEVRRVRKSDAWWQQLKRVMDVMESCYDFLRDMDRDGSSPPGLWDLQSILHREINALQLDGHQRASVTEIVATEEIDDTYVIPADVGEDDWEVTDQVNHRKDGRNRITSVSAGVRMAHAMSPWQDAVWMHREMMEQAQTDQGRGKAVAKDQHDIFDDWATLDPHTNLDSYVDGSFQAVTTLRSRVGGHVNVEGLLVTDDVEVAEEDIERRHDDILAHNDSMDEREDQPVEHRAQHREGMQQVVEQVAGRPGVTQSVVQTVDQRVDVVEEESMGQRVEQRVVDNTDRRLYENAHPRDKDDV
ncbi:hypothetical protein CBR_g40577 [Chara braunii]|uniref:Uncharacterized protein n=1 Tax=Chara braunii TaxID=69332 RepID=A0A388K251_CHABU|nr:hypothetical protein CBR_g40577 [Chara braunii]|eukprot:GBG64130.1 hypothetical protein CBR_g40577 [Chara braunii]